MNIYLGKRRTGQCAGFFFKKGRYLPKRGWELIRFLQAKEQPRLAAWEEAQTQLAATAADK